MLTLDRPRRIEPDLMRVLAALAVVALHVLGYYLATVPAGSAELPLTRALVLCLRFARQAFLFVTGYVLALTLMSRPFAAGPFFSRRARSILLPYLGWSLVYFAVSRHFGMPNADGPWFAALLHNLLWGDGFYHLYYLVVTLQVYLAVPVLVPALRRMAPGRAALGVAAIIAAYPLLMAWWPDGPGTPALLARQDRLFVAYLPYLAAGLAAGAHQDLWQRWVRRWGAVCSAGAALVLAFLLADLARRPYAFADVISVFRPALMAYGLLGSVALWCAAAWLARRGGALAGGLRRLAPFTFGIYLVHPLVLFALEWYLLRPVPARLWHALPLLAAGLAGTYGLVRLLALSPAGAWLVGRSGGQTRIAAAAAGPGPRAAAS